MPIKCSEIKGVPNGSLRKVSLGLNREKLAKIIGINMYNEDNGAYDIADAIIAKESELIEVSKYKGD